MHKSDVTQPLDTHLHSLHQLFFDTADDYKKWNLSPSDFYSLRSAACVFYIEASGNLGDGSSSAAIFSVRPVINLRADVQITKGDGSSLNPFVIR